MTKAEKELEIILNDKIHGSSEILELLIKHFSKYATNPIYLKNAYKKISKKLSHFPVVISFVNEAKNAFNRKSKDEFIEFLKNYKQKNETKYNQLFNKAFPILKEYKSILTISHSKTLINIFNQWWKSDKKIKIIVCESRPEKEGSIMLKELAKTGINVFLTTEAMAGNLIRQTDIVILGADQILPNGDIVNKTGSRMLAILAKHHKIPVYVISTTDKKIKKARIESISITDFYKSDFNKLKLLSTDFEVIENNLITKIITD